MIYGQYAKQYGNRGGGNYKVVSESDAIINYLIKEQNNYDNLLLNESYIDDKERLVMEARLEAINEAAVGAIIAAIIALITAIGILFGKLISMMGKGKDKVVENIKKVAENVEKQKEEPRNTNDNKLGITSTNSQSSQSSAPSSSNNSTNQQNKSGTVYGDKAKTTTTEKSQNKSGTVYGDKAKTTTEKSQKQVDNKKVNEIYKKEVGRIRKEISDQIKNGNIDINSDWFKKISKFFEDDVTLSKGKDGIVGFSMVDLTTVIKADAIKEFTRGIREVSNDNMTDDDLKREDSIRKDNRLGVVGHNGEAKSSGAESISNSVKNGLNYRIFNLSNEFIGENATESIIKYYSKTAKNSIEYIADNYQKFMDSKIYDNAVKVQKQMDRDLNELKSTLERLKKDNYNANLIDSSGSERTFEYYRSKKRFDQYSDDEIKEIIDDNKKEKGLNKEKFLQNMLYIEKNAVSTFKDFLNGWAKIENFRLMYVNQFTAMINKRAVKAASEQIYINMKKQYPSVMNSWKDPYPEYA